MNYFSKGVIIFEIFPYVDIREFANRRLKPDNISTSICIPIFACFINHIHLLISSIFSYIIALIVVMSIGF